MSFRNQITFDSNAAYEDYASHPDSVPAQEITDIVLIGSIDEAPWISNFSNLVALTVETDKIIEIGDFLTNQLRFLDLNRQGLISMSRFWNSPLKLEGFSLSNSAKSSQDFSKLRWQVRSLVLSGPSERSLDFPQIGSVSTLKLVRSSRDISLANVAKAVNLEKLLLVGLRGRITELEHLSACKVLTEIAITGGAWHSGLEEITKIPSLRNVVFVNVRQLPQLVLDELDHRGVRVEVL
jgi:hypothetical protein